MKVRERLATLISQSGMKQAELARRIGKAETWISNRLTGYSSIKADEIPLLAKALGVSPCDFFETAETGQLKSELGQLARRAAELAIMEASQSGRKKPESKALSHPQESRRSKEVEEVNQGQIQPPKVTTHLSSEDIELLRKLIRQEIRAALEEDRRERATRKIEETSSPYEPTYADLAGLDAADVYRNLSPEEREIFRNLVRKAESEKTPSSKD